MEDRSIIDEVRRIRVEFCNEFNNDINAMAEYLRKKEQEHPERLVSYPRKRLKKSTSAQEVRGEYDES